MATLTQTSIELSADLLAKAKNYAHRENRPVEALIEEALLNYMDAAPDSHARSRKYKAEAAALGLTPEEYSVRMIKESRVEQHAENRAG